MPAGRPRISEAAVAVDGTIVRWHVRHAPLVTWVVAVALLAIAIPVVEALAGERAAWIGHGVGHALVGTAALAIAVAQARSWPPPRATAPGRGSRSLLRLGLAAVVIGSLLEAVGARVDEPSAATFEVVAHAAGQMVAFPGLVALAGAGVLAAVSAAREGALPRWVAVGSGAAVLVVLMILMAGAPG